VLISNSIEALKGMLGTTFGGNHLACAAAVAVLDVMKDEHLVENAAETGQYLLDKLAEMAASCPEITDVRGRGLMIGIEVKGSASALRRRLLFEGKIFTGGAGEHTVRLLPALGLTREQADTFLTTFEKFIS
ncbi:MAG: aminotransferase class III-fold pyridoxal phosphate-dependent enzyme, partial [Duncaniella sp.]|nr:aminotransferase class III-fold pyridoxal phosphate-dependent enzyme [Duncaniella sp.]